jgi:hypothetical protein
MTRSLCSAAVGVLLLVVAQVVAQTPRDADGRDAGPPSIARNTGRVAEGNVERGRYLAEHVAMCVECHSGRGAQGQILPEERYMGGPIPPGPPWASDWALRAPRNKGLPGYSEDQAMRLLTQGAINREGRQLQPPMPRYRMNQQDAADVIAFLQSLR